MDVRVRERRLPLVGRQYEMVLPDGVTLTVTVEVNTDDRLLSAREPGRDTPTFEVRLPDAEAVTLATLLSGTHMVFDSQPSDVPRSGVHVETLTISAASPAVGQPVDQLDRADTDAATVLAVIRDDTPELVEPDDDRPCQPGDRLVIAGHPGPLRELREFLIG